MSLDLQDQYDKIYKYCYFKVKNKDLAEDLTQETFLKYFAQNSYTSHGKMLAYLYTIARNLCIDTFRQKQIEALDESILVSIDDKVCTTLAVRQAVEHLNDELTEIIYLRFGSELSINEIAAALNISRFSVHRKLNKALKELNNTLKKEDFYE